MDVSLRWLGALAEDALPEAQEIADLLAARGAPVESIEAPARGLDDIVVARVDEVRPHPNADRLHLCSVVAAPGEEARQVVCGAANVVAGGLYPFAPVGATLPGGTEIGKVKLRGESSEGMLCSERELGLGTDHEGIMLLPGDLSVGGHLVDELGLDDRVLDVEVTANRGDLLSHVGVAREVVPGGVEAIHLPPTPGGPEVSVEYATDAGEATTAHVSVRIEDPDLCLRYLGAVIRGVEVGPSPPWLQARLRSVGARPINNVVDATNYAMLELGQPMHAFDLRRIDGERIVVRRARTDEREFVTLDAETRTLSPDMLMICDDRRPVAIAGVIGGSDSEVRADTTDVLLECALFDPANVRATRRQLGLSTDASYRFERGVDPSGMEAAIERAIEVILAAAGGRVESEVADCNPRPWTPEVVRMRLSRVEAVLGVRFTGAEVHELLAPLGFSVVDPGSGGDVLEIEVPGWRSYDVRREVDLIEEVARTHGYDRFPEELCPYRPGTVPDHRLFQLEDDVRDRLVGLGFYEAQTPAFVSSEHGDVALSNPLSQQEDVLRRALLPSLLRRVEYNWARGVRDVRLFELGTSFHAAEDGAPPVEETRLALVCTGRTRPPHWSEATRTYDLWDLKGVAESMATLVWSGATLEPQAPAGKALDEAHGFTVRSGDGAVVGWAGRVEERAMDRVPWADEVFALEITLPASPEPREAVAFEPLPTFPGSDRDLALLVPEDVPASAVRDVIRATGGPHLTEVEIFDHYAGEGIGAGLRSLAYRLRFQSLERTLTDEEVDAAVSRVLERLGSQLEIVPRG